MASRSVLLNPMLCSAMLLTFGAAPKTAAQQGHANPTDAMTDGAVKWDAKTCLIAARTALARGDLDGAEALAVRAENIPRGLIALIQSHWSDTPAKVFRDIEVARATQRAALINNMQAQEKRNDYNSKSFGASSEKVKSADTTSGFSPIVSVSDFSLAQPAPTSGRADSSLPKNHAVVKYQRAFFDTTSSAGAENIKDRVDFLMGGVKAFLVGDVETTLACAVQAKKRRQDATWSRENIDRLVAFIHARALPNLDSQAPEEGTSAVVPPPIPNKSATNESETVNDTTWTLTARGDFTNGKESEPTITPARKSPRGSAGKWLVFLLFGSCLYFTIRFGPRMCRRLFAVT
jgi:hypothetical protein